VEIRILGDSHLLQTADFVVNLHLSEGK